jgi:tetratricopeptide (TPR) repeat protein
MTRSRRQLLALPLLALLAGCLPLRPDTHPAGTYEDGLRAYQAGHYDEALGTWLEVAERGDAVAQFSLGTLYDQGRGVEKDDAEATRWFRRAAEQGHPAAQHNLGNAYKHGRGVSPSDTEAVLWWRRAADQGMAGAQFNLGTAYLQGQGVASDEAEALAWYRRAAEGGHPVARRLVAGTDRAGAREQAHPAATAAQGTAAGAAWVMAQPPGHFTIQVLSGTSEETVREQADRQPLIGPVVVYPYRHQGTRRFALLNGAFPDRASASRALDGLPRGLRAASPWIRSFGELRALSASSGPPP